MYIYHIKISLRHIHRLGFEGKNLCGISFLENELLNIFLIILKKNKETETLSESIFLLYRQIADEEYVVVERSRFLPFSGEELEQGLPFLK